jgi:RNA polymerase subunit RPABC4/transcription elongation factor Spt4
LENSLNHTNNVKLKFKNGFKYLQEKINICPVCGSSNISENGGRERLIIFSTEKEYFKIQDYMCKNKHKNGESQFFEANIDEIVPSQETASNLDDYFKTISPYLPEEKYITVDSNPKYKEPLEKYGFKRQLCLNHTPKTINNRINNIMTAYNRKGGEINKNDKKIIKEQKQKIIDMILNEDLEEINLIFRDIMDNLEFLHPCIQQLMNKFIIPNFNDFFWYLKVDCVHKTSNAS